MNFFNRKKKPENTPHNATVKMVQQRAHGLMALWAAERMDKSSEEAANYADRMVENADSDASFVQNLLNDLLVNEQHLDAEDLQERLDGFKTVAKLEFEDEDKLQ